MPLYRKLSDESFLLALWRLEEDLSYFESKFSVQPEILNESKKRQWSASRHLLNEVMGRQVEVVKDPSGKPGIRGSHTHLSISHTALFAGVIVSDIHPVGIDLEMVNPKVQRIAHKFLRDDEIASISVDETTRKLILYWSAKEALYKFYGITGIEFKTQLLIEPFEMLSNGELKAEIIAAKGAVTKLKVRYDFFEDHGGV